MFAALTYPKEDSPHTEEIMELFKLTQEIREKYGEIGMALR